MAVTPHIPKYRHDQPKNLVVVRIDGHDHYLGRYDSPESDEKYHRLLAEQYANGKVAPIAAKGPDPAAVTVGELVLADYRHSEQYYVKGGRITNQVRMIRLALKVANVLYGIAPVTEFGPLALKACRAEFVRQGLSRRECNRRTNLVKQAFRWGTENELVPPGVYQAIQTRRPWLSRRIWPTGSGPSARAPTCSSSIRTRTMRTKSLSWLDQIGPIGASHHRRSG